MMDNVQKASNCISISFSETYAFYMQNMVLESFIGLTQSNQAQPGRCIMGHILCPRILHGGDMETVFCTLTAELNII
jgi:hypothetical protein